MINQKQSLSSFIKLINKIKPHIRELEVLELNEKIKNQKFFYLIDVRENHEFQEGSIISAISLTKGIIERDIEKIIPDVEAEIVVYCGGGSRSCLAAYNLKKMGYCCVSSLHGGFRAWLEAGYPVSKKNQ